MASETVLVTGGAGFIGSAVVKRLVERYPTSNVVVLDRLVTGCREFVGGTERVKLHEVDLRRGAEVEAEFKAVAPQRAIHLAAIHYIPYCNQHPAETLEVNVTGTQNVLEACRKYPPKSLVIASSAAVYPIHDSACGEESVSPGPTDIYGLTKHINEQQLQLFSTQSNTRCAAARLFNVYGPNETNPHVLPEILRQMLAGNSDIELGNVKPKRDYVYVTDVAQAIVDLSERNERPLRAYNVGTGSEYSVEEIVSMLGEISGMSLRIKTDPNRMRPSDRMHLLCDRSRIEREIGWQPEFDLRRGLSSLWAWAQQNPAVVKMPFDGKK